MADKPSLALVAPLLDIKDNDPPSIIFVTLGRFQWLTLQQPDTRLVRRLQQPG